MFGKFSHNLHTFCIKVVCSFSNNNGIKFRISVVMECIIVTVAPHQCNGRIWPSPVVSFHAVLEQQQKTRNIKFNH